jgi:hypothetical protein
MNMLQKKVIGETTSDDLRLAVSAETSAASISAIVPHPTLFSNTGLISQPDFEIGLDWLDVTFRNLDGAEHARRVVRDLEHITTDEIEFSPLMPVFNGRRWDGSGRGMKGTRIWYMGRTTDDDGHPVPAQLKVALSGSVIAQTDKTLLAEYLGEVTTHLHPECTRVDFALDDLKKFISLRKINHARLRGNFFNASWKGIQAGGKRGEDEGTSLYFGAVTSDKRLCIYDKFIESGGKINGNRWEARFRKRAAKEVFSQWLKIAKEAPEALPRAMQNWVLGLIDFRDRTGTDPNRERCKVLPWFADLCEVLAATPARVRVSTPVQSIQKSIDWVIKAVAPSLFSIQSVLAEKFPKFLENLLSLGSSNLSNIRRRLLADANRAELIY